LELTIIHCRLWKRCVSRYRTSTFEWGFVMGGGLQDISDLTR